MLTNHAINDYTSSYVTFSVTLCGSFQSFTKHLDMFFKREGEKKD